MARASPRGQYAAGQQALSFTNAGVLGDCRAVGKPSGCSSAGRPSSSRSPYAAGLHRGPRLRRQQLRGLFALGELRVLVEGEQADDLDMVDAELVQPQLEESSSTPTMKELVRLMNIKGKWFDSVMLTSTTLFQGPSSRLHGRCRKASGSSLLVWPLCAWQLAAVAAAVGHGSGEGWLSCGGYHAVTWLFDMREEWLCWTTEWRSKWSISPTSLAPCSAWSPLWNLPCRRCQDLLDIWHPKVSAGACVWWCG